MLYIQGKIKNTIPFRFDKIIFQCKLVRNIIGFYKVFIMLNLTGIGADVLLHAVHGWKKSDSLTVDVADFTPVIAAANLWGQTEYTFRIRR